MSYPAARPAIDTRLLGPEDAVVASLTTQAALTPADRAAIGDAATGLVRQIRAAGNPGLMEVFLAEYGLSTDEGIALMCLAEALLRVPDADTIDALIDDKIAPSDWGRHLGHSTSSLVNASTWALMLTGRVLDDDNHGTGRPGLAGALRGALKRVGEPVIRAAVARAMREMGRQFVLGEDIGKAMKRADGMQDKGFTYSYDMLGEAARTEADARGYHLAYSKAISAIAAHCNKGPNASVADNPGISVKLSALHPRYEVAHHARVMEELVPRLRALALLAKAAGMGLNIDAEEADRLAISLDVIEAALSDPALKGWDGFGVVVQAYGHRAAPVIDWLHALATRLDRRIMVRLVKGAYWDTEIKKAQTDGLEGFPVFTDKRATDISYIANARKLLGMTDRLYPQFATHNAHTVAAVLHLARTMGVTPAQYEFQRLHGMGELLHTMVLADQGTRCRIYAPVGAHEDLLAYLVRRLLENGANSSFVNQIVDEDVPPEEVASDPFEMTRGMSLPTGPELFGERINSRGWDITDVPTLNALDTDRAAFVDTQWQSGPILVRDAAGTEAKAVASPDGSGKVGSVTAATSADVDAACATAVPWAAPVADRAAALRRAADAYEENAPELFALLTREAGKTLSDCIAELREAVDFLRYYADQAEGLGDAGTADAPGPWACISPWNFPLAIFSGQIAAALAAGHAVLAKPAPQTPLIAHRAVTLMHAAGVPVAALQLLPGGAETGAALTAQAGLRGASFTGSTATARAIRRSMAEHAAPGTPLIAETGGLNAMIVDSTALPEHAVRDIVMSSFRSAGQRCSALRCLYVQEDIADDLLKMLRGAMDELTLGDPGDLATDVGPVIDAASREKIDAHVAKAVTEGRLLHRLTAPGTGHFVAPAMISVSSIADMKEEIFGPILHVATFRSKHITRVIDAINATGYGLTFGLHTRIDDRVQTIVDRVHAGNIYVNRNQIGAVVGSQPFGGHGLSGTGPKAGGPNYLPRYLGRAGASVSPMDMPGPTGESNRLTLLPRAPLLCCGPGEETAMQQVRAVRALGGAATMLAGLPGDLATRAGLTGVIWWGDADAARTAERALAAREGPLVPLITGQPDVGHVCEERHVCIDTTAAGGNAQLLAEVSR